MRSANRARLARLPRATCAVGAIALIAPQEAVGSPPTATVPSPPLGVDRGQHAIDSGLVSPAGVAIGPEGDLYVVGGGREVIAPDESVRIIDSDFDGTTAVVVHASGDAYVTDGLGVRKVTPDGTGAPRGDSSVSDGWAGAGILAMICT